MKQQVSTTLSQRVIKGGFWIFSAQIIGRLLSLIRTIVLARVLAPDDFGLMGIAIFSMSALEIFSQTGFEPALIQRKKNTHLFLDTAWTVQVMRGLLLFILLFILAPLAASFFQVPEAKSIIQVIALANLFRGFTNIGVIYFQKELEFQKQFIYQISGILADLAIAIPAALILRSAWALVFGFLSANLVRLAVSYLIHSYRPQLKFQLRKAKELAGFGRWLLGSSILIFLLTQGDDALVGKVLGVTALGFYQLAYKISNIPATEISHSISQIAFPAYSKLQDNLPSLRRAYIKTLQLTVFVSIPLAGGIFILAPEFTQIFLGTQWMPMVPALQILCIFGALRSIAAASGPIFLATGRPDIEAKLPAAQLVLLAVLIYPLTLKWGISGTAVSLVIVSCSFIFVILTVVARLLKMSKSDILNLARNIVFPLLAILSLLPVKLFIVEPLVENQLWLFGTIIVLGLFIYSAAIYVLDKYSSYNVLANLNYVWQRVRR